MPEGKPPSTRVLFALSVVTAASLAFQVIFTRMLSSVMAYHFSFLVVSLALLGTGTGALLIYVRPAWFDRGTIEQNLARWSAVYAVLLIVTPFVLVHLNYSTDHGITWVYSLNLAAACVLAAAPAMAAGVVVALAIRGYTSHVSRVYAWDLVGAGIGAFVVVPLLWYPAPVLLVGLGSFVAIAAVLFGWRTNRERYAGGGLMVAGALVTLVAALGSSLYLPMGYTGHKVADIWSPLSRAQGFTLGQNGVLFYDRVYAPVPGYVNGKPPNWQSMNLGPQSIGYELTGPGHALVIGGGGGRDIWNALSEKQKVDVIELSRANVNVVDKKLGKISGHPYTRPGVHTTVGDGRSVLARSHKKYDQIHIGFTDTLSANAAAGFALSENNLYTVEAFEEYFNHLNPDGILNVSRLERLVGDEAIRATVLTEAALEKRGIKNPLANMVVLRGKDTIQAYGAPYETILAKLTPFTPAELQQIRTLAKTRTSGIAMAPGGPYYGAWAQLAKAKSISSFCTSYQLNICPPTDNKPFFFNMRRPLELDRSNANYHYSVDPYVLLLLTLAILVVLSVIGLLLPLLFAKDSKRPGVSNLGYFGAIGLGFMFLESVLIQRFVLFLGFPTYSLSVVLFALLVFTGIGSAISTRLPHTRKTLTIVLALIVLVVTVGAYNLQGLLRGGLLQQPLPMRILLTCVLIAPLGVLLGMPMPIGLTRLSKRHQSGVPYAWGVNGFLSVVGSVLAVALAIDWGYVVGTLAAAVCYLVALGAAWLGRWEAGPSTEPEVERGEPAIVEADESLAPAST